MLFPHWCLVSPKGRLANFCEGRIHVQRRQWLLYHVWQQQHVFLHHRLRSLPPFPSAGADPVRGRRVRVRTQGSVSKSHCALYGTTSEYRNIWNKRFSIHSVYVSRPRCCKKLTLDDRAPQFVRSLFLHSWPPCWKARLYGDINCSGFDVVLAGGSVHHELP